MNSQGFQDSLILRDIYGYRLRNLVRAVSSRLLLLGHACVAVWLTTEIHTDPRIWGLLPASLLLFAIEGLVTILVKKGREWQWFCPSFFCYLVTIIPCLWVQHLTVLEHLRAEQTPIETYSSVEHTTSNVTVVIPASTVNTVTVFSPIATTTQDLENTTYSGVISTQSSRLEHSITLPGLGTMQSVLVSSVVEQSMMVVIIFGRWLLPRGYFSRGVLSQLLLVYLSLFADIIDFSELRRIRDDVRLCILVMGFWSLSLFQFCFIAVSKKESNTNVYQNEQTAQNGESTKRDSGDICGLLTVCLMHDGPFLIVRLLILIKYQEINNTIIFFLCKNILTIVLQIYRLLIVCFCISQHASDSIVLDNTILST